MLTPIRQRARERPAAAVADGNAVLEQHHADVGIERVAPVRPHRVERDRDAAADVVPFDPFGVRERDRVGLAPERGEHRAGGVDRAHAASAARSRRGAGAGGRAAPARRGRAQARRGECRQARAVRARTSATALTPPGRSETKTRSASNSGARTRPCTAGARTGRRARPSLDLRPRTASSQTQASSSLARSANSSGGSAAASTSASGVPSSPNESISLCRGKRATSQRAMSQPKANVDSVQASPLPARRRRSRARPPAMRCASAATRLSSARAACSCAVDSGYAI